jgi:hypothetical protein
MYEDFTIDHRPRQYQTPSCLILMKGNSLVDDKVINYFPCLLVSFFSLKEKIL